MLLICALGLIIIASYLAAMPLTEAYKSVISVLVHIYTSVHVNLIKLKPA